MVSLTIFDSIYDNKTNKRMDYNSFDEFEAVLYKLSESTKYPTKKDAPLISPATYIPDTTRGNDNVVGWGMWCALDIDDFEGDIEDIKKTYGEYRFVCYSTASSTKDQPKFRLVFPLSKDVDKEKIKHFWFALNKEVGDVADAQTKDLSRMYYVPAKYKDAFNFIFSQDGKVMDPDYLMDKHPYVVPNENFFDRLPEAIKKGLIEHRKGKLNNTNITWTNYSDCPFVNQKQIDEYKTISGTGWYAKMYQIMCTIAGNAMNRGYPITAKEVEYLCRELDADTGNWYLKRDMYKEAERAIEFIFRNNI
jgi:hypothetical protein|tara:strand:- start:190 stop:1107 length:918 start_codon:yes stop_codon:yes gene_type:complete